MVSTTTSVGRFWSSYTPEHNKTKEETAAEESTTEETNTETVKEPVKEPANTPTKVESTNQKPTRGMPGGAC